MEDIIVCIPTKYRREIEGFRMNTLNIGLQDVPGIKIILFYYGSEKLALLDALKNEKIENVKTEVHWLKSISEIRYYMRQYCLDKYPTKFNWQMDDDVKFFRQLSNALVQRNVTSADIIADYMRELGKKARRENAQCFAPHSTFRHITVRSCRFGHYSYRAQCRGIMGFIPGAPNTFDPDPRILSFEETLMQLKMENLCIGTDMKAFMRDNFTAVVTENDSPLDDDESREYAVKKAVEQFGGGRVIFLHRSLKSMVDAMEAE